MFSEKNLWQIRITIMFALITILGCNIFSGRESIMELEITPTPTTPSSILSPTKSGPSSRCKDLSGSLELQVLVGPGDAVGLESFVVGEIPFSIHEVGESFSVQGGDSLNYHEVLEEEWGTFSVDFDMEASIKGHCVDNEDNGQLDLILEATGDQMVEVRSEGFQGDYPWSGTHEFELSFPLEEGAQQKGEGWVLVLHLKE